MATHMQTAAAVEARIAELRRIAADPTIATFLDRRSLENSIWELEWVLNGPAS